MYSSHASRLFMDRIDEEMQIRSLPNELDLSNHNEDIA